jgi:PIN domain nuclease of toxin-antitoxin system
MTPEPELLLDTCTIIFLSYGSQISAKSRSALSARMLWVSPMSAWELAMLMAAGRFKSPLQPEPFLETFLRETGSEICSLPISVIMAAPFLPGILHRDSIDRILIATARALRLVLVTRDRAILDYGAAGHVRTLAC